MFNFCVTKFEKCLAGCFQFFTKYYTFIKVVIVTIMISHDATMAFSMCHMDVDGDKCHLCIAIGITHLQFHGQSLKNFDHLADR